MRAPKTLKNNFCDKTIAEIRSSRLYKDLDKRFGKSKLKKADLCAILNTKAMCPKPSRKITGKATKTAESSTKRKRSSKKTSTNVGSVKRSAKKISTNSKTSKYAPKKTWASLGMGNHKHFSVPPRLIISHKPSYTAKKATRAIWKVIKRCKVNRHRCTGIETSLWHGHRIAWLTFLLKTQKFKPSEACFATKLDLYRREKKGWTASFENRGHCMSKANIIIVPVSMRIEGRKSKHANMLIVDHALRTIELFEPHGYRKGSSTFDNREFLRLNANKLFSLSNYEFVTPYDTCPLIAGPQHFAGKPTRCTTGGYCATMSSIYAHVRILAPNDPPVNVVQAILAIGKGKLQEFVLRYLTWQEMVLSANGVTVKNKRRQ